MGGGGRFNRRIYSDKNPDSLGCHFAILKYQFINLIYKSTKKKKDSDDFGKKKKGAKMGGRYSPYSAPLLDPPLKWRAFTCVIICFGVSKG